MISFKGYVLYGTCIYIGGATGHNIVNSILYRILNGNDSIYYYRNSNNYLKYNLIGTLVGSSLGFLLCKKINNVNFIETLKITN